MDRAMAILGELKEAEAAAKRGEKFEEPPAAPRAIAPPQPRPAPPQPARPPPPTARPAPAASRPPSDDEHLPPPPRIAGQGKLDDIFGGAQQEGRVRIGAPKKKTLE